MPSVLVYTRLSTVDLNAATDRQEAACLAYATARGWEVADVLCDVDASAYQRTRRPAFEELVREAEARTCDGLLVWKLDRLVRRPADFERLWDAAERQRVFVASVMEPVDSSTPMGLAMLRILVALAGLESATTAERVRASKRAGAERGEPPPVKAYGHSERWDALVETEAAVIREAAALVLAGERLAAIARDLRQRGVPSPTGGHWNDATLGRILRNPRIVGDRAYRGEIVARDCWPAIIDRDTFARLQVTLNNPHRRGAPTRHKTRLATGYVTCGLCGQRMNTTTRGGVRYFSCVTAPTGCGRVHVKADALEDWLLDQLLTELQHGEPAPSAPSPVDGTAEALLQLSQDYYVHRIVSRDEFLSARAGLARQAETASRVSGRRPEVARVLAAADPRRALGRLDTAVLRDLLAPRLDRIVVQPAVSRGPFNPQRLSCIWVNTGHEAGGLPPENGSCGDHPPPRRVAISSPRVENHTGVITAGGSKNLEERGPCP